MASSEDMALPGAASNGPSDAIQLPNEWQSRMQAFARQSSTERSTHQIQEVEGWLSTAAHDHPDRPAHLYLLGSLLNLRMLQTGTSHDLQRAIEAVEMAFNATNPAKPFQFVEYASKLGHLLGQRFRHSRARDDIDRAIVASGATVQVVLENRALFLDPARFFCGHAVNLAKRCEGDLNIDDLNLAITFVEQATEACRSQGDYAMCQLLLSGYLGRRSQQITEGESLDRAVKAAEYAAAVMDSEESDFNLANQLAIRFQQTQVMDDINHAIAICFRAVERKHVQTNHTASMMQIALLLGMRFETTHAFDDIDVAVDLAERVVAATNPDSVEVAEALVNLGELLGWRFEYTGSAEDIERAVEMADKTMSIPGIGSQIHARGLHCLGVQLTRRFRHTGKREDINRAIEIGNAAVETLTPAHTSRGACMSFLAESLFNRYKAIGMKADLDHAINVAVDAIDLMPTSHPHRPKRLNNLSNYFSERAEWTGLTDRDHAVRVAESAVSRVPPSSHHRAGFLNTLALHLHRRFQLTGSASDIDRAIETAQKAVAANSTNDLAAVTRFNTLGNSLYQRFHESKALEDLNQAIEAYESAIAITSDDYMDRGGILLELGVGLVDRAYLTSLESDCENALKHFEQGWECHNSPPSVRIKLAQGMSAFYRSDMFSGMGWERSSSILQDAVELLPNVSPRSLQDVEKQRMLSQYSHLASSATESALQAGRETYHALKLLELGRTVIAGLILETRTDISDLAQVHPDLAKEFAKLRDELDAPSEKIDPEFATMMVKSSVSQASHRIEAEQRFRHVVSSIRAQPSFHSFLLPPSQEDIMAAAALGPIVVINVARSRSDAFLIERHRIRVLNLPGLEANKVQQKVQQMTHYLRSEATAFRIKSTLEWMWDVIACPILDALGFKEPVTDDNWPTMWWVLTGALCHLPLHAAGRMYPNSTEIVLHRVISCYSSSVKALIHSRRRRPKVPKSGVSEYALLLEMNETPGLSQNGALPFAKDEIAMLDQILPALSLKPLKPTPRKQDVTECLSRCKIFHFAGHGYSDAIEPSQSCLLLEDWESNPLTVDDLRKIWLQDSSPFLSYLSACSTGANRMDALVEEGIHLISSFQLAGFRHVIGTLWEVSDQHCIDVARVVYETLRDEGLTDRAVSHGLHKATRALLKADLATRGTRNSHRNLTQNSSALLEHAVTPQNEDASISAVLPKIGELSDLVREFTFPPKRLTGGGDTVSERISKADHQAVREERDATLLMGGADNNDSMNVEREPPLYWVPYVHYGV